MARTITDEEIKLSIIINGNPAQKQLLDLEKATRKLTEENKALIVERRRLEAQGKKDTAEYKALTSTIKANTTAIDNNKASMKELQNQIGITGLSIGQLRDKANQLRMTLKNLIPDSADFKKYDAELRQVNARLGELTNKAQGSKFSLSSIADGFNKYQALALSIVATFTGVVLSIQKIIDMNGKLSDAQADVMKTTGMTKDEVDDLTKSFGALETRTSRIDLLKIAEQGGRIGIAKEEIQDFVKNMNMANVALGDSFTGGVEEVANKLGKLKFLFQETKDMSVDKSYNAIGSAINDLGANGVASEANITEFATRLGSLPDVLKPTIKEALALGAAFEESGIEAEVSSRAYNIFMKQASTESAKFAQVMGISKKAVEDMINTNPLDFMMQFAQGMRGMDATDTAKTLDFLGVNADGANKVIGAMGNNMERFRELIDLSNNSFESGTSLVNEYNVKNENLAATLEKIKKTVAGFFSSESFIKWLSSSVLWLAKFIGASEDADGSITGFRNKLIFFIKVLTVLLVSIVSYNAAIRLTAAYSRTLATVQTLVNAASGKGKIITDILRGSYLLLSAATNTVTGNTIRANAAMKLLNTTVKTSPFGILLSALLAVGTAFVLFKSNADRAAGSMNELNSETKLTGQINAQFNRDFGKASSDLKARVEPLVSILNNQNVSLFTRKKAYEDLIAISPQFEGTVNKEFLATSKLKDVYAQLLENMKEKMRFEAMQKVFQSKYDQEAKALENLIKQETKYNTIQEKRRAFNKKLEASGTSYGGESDGASEENLKAFRDLQNAQKAYVKAGVEINVIENYRIKQIEELTKQQKKYNEKSKEWLDLQSKINILAGSPKSTTVTPVTSNFNVPGDKDADTKRDPNSSADDIKLLEVQNDDKYNDILLRNRRQYWDDRISLMLEGTEKEIAIENLRAQREIDDLKTQKVHDEQMAKLQDDISKAEIAGDITKKNALIKIKEEWAKRNEIIDTQINGIIEGKLKLHNVKLGIIYEKAEKTKIENLQKEFEHQKLLRETDYNNQLAALGDNEIAKEKLKKEYEKKELEETEKHLQQLIKRLKANLALGNIFNLLTPADRDKIQKDLDFALNALSQVQKAKKGESKFSEAARSVFGQTDILGFTPNQWESTFQNLDTLKGQLEAVNMVVSGLQNMWSTYSNFQTASENRNLKNFEVNSDKKKARLKRQLDAGYINQATYDKQIKRIDDEYEKRKLEIEYKQAKREKAQALFGAIVNTAKGITAAIPNPFLMSLAAIVGGLQIATIAKTPLPARGYEEGLYPVKREQDGKIFQSRFGGKTKSGLVTKPTYFLTGENGPELILDSRAYSQISPAVKNALWNELKGIKGFENGMYNQSAQRFEVPASSAPSSSSNSDRLLEMALVVIAENTAVMKDLRDKGVEGRFYKGDLQSAKNIKDSISDYETLRNKNKL